MKKMLLAAVAASTIVATPALAQNNLSSTYDVKGTVEAVCSVATGGIVNFGALTGIDGSINTAAAPTSATADDNAYCNGAKSTLTVTHAAMTLRDSGGAVVGGSAPSGFVKTVDFTPVVKVGDVATEYNTGEAEVGAFSGLSVTAKTPTVTANTKPLAGDYQGSITIVVAPVA